MARPGERVGCAIFACGKLATHEGWCEEHRYGKCETPGCGKRATGRVALSSFETVQAMGGSVLMTKYGGSPLACDECQDPEVRAMKVEEAKAAKAGARK